MAAEALATGMRRRVFLVEDHPVTREGLAQLVNAQPDLQVCGLAGSAPEALDGILRCRPDLAVIDILLGGTSGLELIKGLRSQLPQLAVLVLSTYSESVYAERALRAGARGYAMKQAPTQEVLEAMRRVLRGEVHLSESMSSRVLSRLRGPRSSVAMTEEEQLTDRELEVFQMLGQGLGTREIARHLHLSVSTVETHRAHIKEKLGLRSGMELVRRAVTWVDRGVK